MARQARRLCLGRDGASSSPVSYPAMSRLFPALLAAVLLFSACDSGTDNPGGSTDGYTGNPSLLGTWERLDSTNEQPTVGYERFVEISYSAPARTVSYREWSKYDDDSCWQTESGQIYDVTATTIAEDGPGTTPRRYTADRERLAFYDTGATAPDALYRRSSRSTTSFTPICS